jgi:hypothetical protein
LNPIEDDSTSGNRPNDEDPWSNYSACSVSTPIATRTRLLKTGNGDEKAEQQLYQSMIGFIIEVLPLFEPNFQVRNFIEISNGVQEDIDPPTES